MRRILFLSILALFLRLAAPAQQGTVQTTASSLKTQPQEIANPVIAPAEQRSVTAPDLNSLGLPSPTHSPSTTDENPQNIQAELPKREKSIDD
jgi:hypothetical protein